MKRLILVFGIAVLLLMVTVYANGNPVETLFQLLTQKLDEMIQKLNEIKTTIEGIEVSPEVNVKPNITVIPNVTLPEKECEPEYGTEDIQEFNGGRSDKTFFFTYPKNIVYNDFNVTRGRYEISVKVRYNVQCYYRVYVNDQLIYERDSTGCGTECNFIFSDTVDTTDSSILSAFRGGINKLSVKWEGSSCYVVSGTWSITNVHTEYQNTPANC